MSTLADFSIGVDLHKTAIQVCVVDRSGEIVHEHRFNVPTRGHSGALFALLSRYHGRCRIAVEAIGLNRWFVNMLLDRDYPVVVCDPLKLGLKVLGKKTDRRDAREIARRLHLGDIDRAAMTWYPSDETYGRRKVLRSRHALLEHRQRVINQIRALLNAYKITSIEGELTGKRTRVQLSHLELPTEELTTTLQAWLSLLSSLGESIALLDQQLKQMERGGLAENLARSLPWAGSLTAAVLVHELGDVTRFTGSRAVASYAGLVPRVSQSGDTSHHGRLTKRGNRELRHVLGEWAVRLLSHDALVQSWAAPRLRRSHKNKVRMALARRLLVGVYKMMLTGEAFSLARCLGLAEPEPALS